jgi:two-component system response regulator LytT
MILNCIAVDDEPLALGMVCSFIEQTPFLRLTGRYDNAVETLKGLHQQSVDLIFLDIQMPGLTGIELARVLDRGRDLTGPRIIFTTAYNQFALEGYKVDALDYLLKPFSYEEFLVAANKARAYAELLHRPAAQAPVARPPAAPEQEAEYLFLKVEYQLVRIPLKDILYIQGLKDYVKVYLQDAKNPILSLSSLKALEEKLPARRFMRIHRSFIVSLDQIKAVSRNTVQIGEKQISVSDQYKEAFNQFLSRWSS